MPNCLDGVVNVQVKVKVLHQPTRETVQKSVPKGRSRRVLSTTDDIQRDSFVHPPSLFIVS